LNVVAGEIYGSIEDQPVNAGGYRGLAIQQIGDSTILVGCSFAQQLPAARGRDFQSDGDAAGRPAAGSIKHVRRNAAH
jgi:hypothetical protein